MATTVARQEVNIYLPRPHGEQLRFRNSAAKRKVICAGRRGGKTTGVALLAVELLLAGRRVLEAAPTADQTDAFWQACCHALAKPIAAGVVRKNETQRILELPSVPLAINTPPNPNLVESLQIEVIPRLPRIRCKTAHDADSLRGDYADQLILDEYSIMHRSAWEEVGAPMLLDNNGDATFIFTPKRLNHAHDLYQRAVSDTTGRWEAFHFTSHDNPYLSKAALAEITQDMTEDDYKQEILAQFLQNAGAVFRNIDACLMAPATQPARHVDHIKVAGVDLAQKQDFTACSVYCATCDQELALERWNQLGWSLQRGRLLNVLLKWGVQFALIELNSIGQPNFEALLELVPPTLTLVGFETTARTKPSLIQQAALAFERVDCAFLPDPVGRHELLAYECQITGNGHPKYSAPEGGFDDTVMARCLTLEAKRRNPAPPLSRDEQLDRQAQRFTMSEEELAKRTPQQVARHIDAVHRKRVQLEEEFDRANTSEYEQFLKNNHF